MPHLLYEKALFKKGYKHIAGVDEAGRGPLAGPVFAAAVILPAGFDHGRINDSKQLSPEEREELFELIVSSVSNCSVSFADNKEIDRTNILKATFRSMRQAIEGLCQRADYVLVDGKLKIRDLDIEQKAIVKGDGSSASIAAASIIAKVSRDRYMTRMAERYPQYGFDKHKGYGTEEHIAAIAKYGPCEIHRMSFEPIKSLASGTAQ